MSSESTEPSKHHVVSIPGLLKKVRVSLEKAQHKLGNETVIDKTNALFEDGTHLTQQEIDLINEHFAREEQLRENS